jgi:hypothetical protein
LQIWAKTIAHEKLGMPFRNIFDKPTLYPERFISDATGAVFAWKEGTCKNITETGDPGVAPWVLQTTEFYLFPPRNCQSLSMGQWAGAMDLEAQYSMQLVFSSLFYKVQRNSQADMSFWK